MTAMTPAQLFDGIQKLVFRHLDLMSSFSPDHYELPNRNVKVDRNQVHVTDDLASEVCIIVGQCETKVVVKGGKVEWWSHSTFRSTSGMNPLGLETLSQQIGLLSYITSKAFATFGDVEVVYAEAERARIGNAAELLINKKLREAFPGRGFGPPKMERDGKLWLFPMGFGNLQLAFPKDEVKPEVNYFPNFHPSKSGLTQPSWEDLHKELTIIKEVAMELSVPVITTVQKVNAK